MRVPSKHDFYAGLEGIVDMLKTHANTPNGHWTVKGFIDTCRKIYSLSSDTKVLSKVLEIQALPTLLGFARSRGYELIPADKQNYYPDVSFVGNGCRFALDFKTTYRIPDRPDFCNGFTLGSHGSYFVNRDEKKNIQFPYNTYSGHFCLGIIYTRSTLSLTNETKPFELAQLESIPSVIRNIQFFVAEKWKIASDRRGSGNTANIGSIKRISDIVSGQGMFARLGEKWFDDYWMNYGKITVRQGSGQTKKITNLHDFVAYRGGDTRLISPKVERQVAK